MSAQFNDDWEEIDGATKDSVAASTVASSIDATSTSDDDTAWTITDANLDNRTLASPQAAIEEKHETEGAFKEDQPTLDDTQTVRQALVAMKELNSATMCLLEVQEKELSTVQGKHARLQEHLSELLRGLTTTGDPAAIEPSSSLQFSNAALIRIGRNEEDRQKLDGALSSALSRCENPGELNELCGTLRDFLPFSTLIRNLRAEYSQQN